MDGTDIAPGEMVVDIAAIRHNVRVLRQLVGVPVIAVVKADGYGHGMVAAARAAREGGAEWVAVAHPMEALNLRSAGDVGPLLCWLSVPDVDYGAMIEAGIDITAYSVAQIDAIAPAARRLRTAARIQLKVDTGLSRGGAVRAEWRSFFARARAGEVDQSCVVTGLWSHFACSDQPDHVANDLQQVEFDDAVQLAAAAGLRPRIRHLSNSAASILRPSARYDAVRCGIAIYGLDPAPGQASDIGLRPAMTVRTRLALVKSIPSGACVSYGHTWKADRDTTVGLVPVGYADGIPRSAWGSRNAAEVKVGAKRYPIRGTICMDQFVIDLGGDQPPDHSEVVILGPPQDNTPTAQDWAQASGTISYEIVTRMGGGRMNRRYVDSDVD